MLAEFICSNARNLICVHIIEYIQKHYLFLFCFAFVLFFLNAFFLFKADMKRC